MIAKGAMQWTAACAMALFGCGDGHDAETTAKSVLHARTVQQPSGRDAEVLPPRLSSRDGGPASTVAIDPAAKPTADGSQVQAKLPYLCQVYNGMPDSPNWTTNYYVNRRLLFLYLRHQGSDSVNRRAAEQIAKALGGRLHEFKGYFSRMERTIAMYRRLIREQKALPSGHPQKYKLNRLSEQLKDDLLVVRLMNEGRCVVGYATVWFDFRDFDRCKKLARQAEKDRRVFAARCDD